MISNKKGSSDRLIKSTANIAENGNALLICRKKDEQRIKQFMADTQLKYDDEFN